MGFNSYGSTDTSKCPLCRAPALIKNKSGISVCKQHSTFEFPELSCSCGEVMKLKDGKFGPFCICSRCGVTNLKKALEMNKVDFAAKDMERREIVVDAKNAHLFGLRYDF